MESAAATGAERRVITYCLLPRDLAGKLHEPLREHFAGDPAVEVIVERRRSERRAVPERRERLGSLLAQPAERRRVRNRAGRRAGDRRAAQVPAGSSDLLPERARSYADWITFVEVCEPADSYIEDQQTARLVTRIQSGAADEFASLYMRYFDRVYSYLKLALNDARAAEDATQQVFNDVIQALPGYDCGGQPFRAWLVAFARSRAIERLAPLEAAPVFGAGETRDLAGESVEQSIEALRWINDRELLMFVERLPDAARQVIVLRFMMGLATADVATILGMSADDVRLLQRRGLDLLEERLAALGAHESACERRSMRRRWRPAPVLYARRFQTVP